MTERLLVWATLFSAEAVRSLLRHKVRSGLTTLGIMIGIAAAVLVVAIGSAGSERAEAQLHNLGDNLVWIEAGSRSISGVRTGSHGMTNLTIDDADAIVHEVPLIKSMSPQVDGSVQITFENRNWNTRYRGVTPDYLDIKRWTVAEGTAFSRDDVAREANVCLIGQTARREVFGPIDPVGQVLRVGSQMFVVVGLLAPKGQSATGQDQDDTIFLPYTTVQKKLKGRGYEWLDDILCSAVSSEAVAPAIESIVALMRERHAIRADAPDDFNIRRPEELINAEIEASRTLATLLLSVASISLLVGGIGIMNVMLASVAQRTREIGLRLAVGARKVDVQVQFLGEAVVLSLFGGLFGIGLSVVGCSVFGEALGWALAIPARALGLAVVFAVAVGVFFGFYPAWKAARLDPITALRHE